MMRDEPPPPELASMFAVERPVPAAPPQAIARVQTRLHASIAAGYGGPGVTGLVAAKPVIVIALVAIVAGGVVALRAFGDDPPDARVAAPPNATPPTRSALPPPQIPPTESVAPRSLPTPAPSLPEPAVSATPPVARDPEPAKVVQPPPSERDLVERATGCLARRESSCALAAVTEHARWYPDGALAEEREAAWIEALVLAGDTVAAQKRAQVFREAHPNSIYNAEIRRALPPP